MEMQVAMSTDTKRKHYELRNVGLRAQATAAGLVQLCKELQHVGILEESAVGRIKEAIADELEIDAPRSMPIPKYRRDVRERLDRIFSGEEKVGDRLDHSSAQAVED